MTLSRANGQYSMVKVIAVLSIDMFFNSAIIRIQIEERAIAGTVTEDCVGINFPTTRRLAEYPDIPHYCVPPYFAAREPAELVTGAGRVGILTTGTGRV